MNIALMLAAKALKEIKKIKADIGSTIQEYLSANPIETLVLDKKLEKENLAADAKATGDALKKKATGEGITLAINESGGLRVTYDDER